jgi:hypothetical protein
MDYIRLQYQTSKTIDAVVLNVHGASEPDHLTKFPGLVHEMLDGSLSDQNAGSRREITVGFQTMTAAKRRQLADWWIDEDACLVCLMTAPTQSDIALVSGTLVETSTYYYKIRAIDMLGGGATSNEKNTGVLAADQGASLTWTAIDGARMYAVYRKKDAENWFLIDYAMANSYVDVGTIIDATAVKDTGSSTLSLTASVIHVLTPQELVFTWAYDTELNRMIEALELREKTIFLKADGFPI